MISDAAFNSMQSKRRWEVQLQASLIPIFFSFVLIFILEMTFLSLNLENDSTEVEYLKNVSHECRTLSQKYTWKSIINKSGRSPSGESKSLESFWKVLVL